MKVPFDTFSPDLDLDNLGEQVRLGADVRVFRSAAQVLVAIGVLCEL